jgi:hypothetical protein
MRVAEPHALEVNPTVLSCSIQMWFPVWVSDHSVAILSVLLLCT